MRNERYYCRSQEDAQKGSYVHFYHHRLLVERITWYGEEKNKQILPILTMIQSICPRSGFRQVDLPYHTTVPDLVCGILVPWKECLGHKYGKQQTHRRRKKMPTNETICSASCFFTLNISSCVLGITIDLITSKYITQYALQSLIEIKKPCL